MGCCLVSWLVRFPGDGPFYKCDHPLLIGQPPHKNSLSSLTLVFNKTTSEKLCPFYVNEHSTQSNLRRWKATKLANLQSLLKSARFSDWWLSFEYFFESWGWYFSVNSMTVSHTTRFCADYHFLNFHW